MKKSRRDLSIGALAGAFVFALAQMCAFAQTATTTTSMLLAPKKPVATAHAHSMASAPSAQQTATPQHMRKGMSMHKPDWSKMPTGVAATNGATTVTPLDPNTIPKFVNQLTRPATFVASGTKFDPQLGRNVPLYNVTEVQTTQQILPPGFPRTP